MSNWSSLIPPHLWTPQLGIHEGLFNNLILYSLNDDVFFVPTSLPSDPLAIFRILNAVIDDRDIIESLNRANTTSCQLLLQRHAMNQREKNKWGYYGKMVTETTPDFKSSPQYRGVIKVNEDRYEAFVWDNTISEGSGRIVYIGGYTTELEAARAHDLVSIKLYGQNTVTNFPASCYEHEFSEMQKMSKKEYFFDMRRRGKGYSGRDSPYRGIYRIPEARRWEAWLGQDKTFSPKIFLGRYYTAEDAARAYDITLIKFKGMDAITNFELSTYEVNGILETIKPLTMQTVPTKSGLLLQTGSSEASYLNNFLCQQLLTQQLSNSSSSSHGYNNFDLIQSHPYTSGIRNNHNSVGNNGANVDQPLIQQLSNSTSSFHGCQNQNLISYPYSIGGLNGTGSGVGLGTYDNSVGNYGAMFPNQVANVEQSQLLGTGQDFQAPEAQQNQLNVNINNEFHHGNQNLGLQNPQVEPTNQEVEATLQVPILEDQSSEPHNYHPNNLNQNTNQNFKSSFFNTFLNLCSETNTDSLSQIIEGLDDPDLSEILNSSGDSFQNPCSKTNTTGSQSLMTGNLGGSYIMEGEIDWSGDLDKFWAEMDADNGL